MASSTPRLPAAGLPNSSAGLTGQNMSSTISSHSKCMKCGIISNVSELEDNPEGVGKICINTTQCTEHQERLARTEESQR